MKGKGVMKLLNSSCRSVWGGLVSISVRKGLRPGQLFSNSGFIRLRLCNLSALKCLDLCNIYIFELHARTVNKCKEIINDFDHDMLTVCCVSVAAY